VADERKETGARSVEGRASGDVPAREVNMLDLFYVAVVIAFFALIWGFTKSAERL
jgi:hypothetical protein